MPPFLHDIAGDLRARKLRDKSIAFGSGSGLACKFLSITQDAQCEPTHLDRPRLYHHHRIARRYRCNGITIVLGELPRNQCNRAGCACSTRKSSKTEYSISRSRECECIASTTCFVASLSPSRVNCRYTIRIPGPALTNATAVRIRRRSITLSRISGVTLPIPAKAP